MSQRKQSLNEQQVVSREQSAEVPSAGVPPIKSVEYDGSAANDIADVEEAIEPDERITLKAPRDVDIESQNISFAPDGSQSVTLVLSFDEVEAAESYEYRIAKK